jgi:phosphate transport system ATP-binding protein
MFLGEVIEHGPTPDIFLKPRKRETEMYVEGRYG